MRRAAALLATLALAAAPAARFEQARPPVRLAFPRDHGSHPGFRTEWWYVTGWLDGPGGRKRGFQVTFFRTATGIAGTGRFAPGQILFAHAALSDPAVGHLLHGARASRAVTGVAQASRGDADLAVDDWRLRRLPDGRFVTHVAGDGFVMDLTFRPTGPAIAQGERGYSRKGPDPRSASIYYSMPHLAVTGRVRQGATAAAVTGSAWLDREWSSSYLAKGATGWDWTGLNFDDGAALMAFRIRRPDGTGLWAGGSYRDARGRLTILGPRDVAFAARRRWRSARTGAVYPVDPVVAVRLPGGVRRFPLTPLFPDQELDSRPAGPVYWEGAVRAPGARGYLELTGYAQHLEL